jgi:hypothetical protein
LESLDFPQLDLFEERFYLLRRAWSALSSGSLAECSALIAAFRDRYPADAAGGREAQRLAVLCDRLEAIHRLSPERQAPMLLGLAREIQRRDPASPVEEMRRALLREAGLAHQRAAGDAAPLEGWPAGYYLAEGGSLPDARASLIGALRKRRRPRYLFLLADICHELGNEDEARMRYCEALLQNPFDAAFARVRDEEVRTLPQVARYELEIEEDPRAWSAPVGVVTGVFFRPALFPQIPGPGEPADSPAHPAEREALRHAREFLAALDRAAGADRAGVLESRRAMKALSPKLFAAYLERRP